MILALKSSSLFGYRLLKSICIFLQHFGKWKRTEQPEVHVTTMRLWDSE